MAAYQNTMTGLMNPSSYEQGFVNPFPDGTQQLTGPLGGGGYQPQNDMFQNANINSTQYYTPNYANPSINANNGVLNVGQQNTNNSQLGAQTNTNASGANDPVSGLYQSLLGRAPDAAGLAYWQGQLASGKSIQDIANAFKGTPEYQQRNPQIQPNPSTQPNTNPYGITTANPFSSSTNPYIQAAQQTSLGNLAGAQTATAANRVNQQTPYGSLQYTQTGTDAQGNPIWSANQSLSPQLQALTQQSLTGLQNSLTNPAYGINPGQTYSDAIMQRLQPQQRQAQERLDAQLANQGIMPGSEAYNRAKTLQSQSLNDQLTSAIVGGMQTGLQANTAQNQTAANIRALSNPNYINPYSQAATSGPDYTGAYATSQAADIAARNAQLAQKNNLTSGLFNIGTAGVLASGGIPGLVNAGTQAYDWLSKIGGSTNPGLVLGDGTYTTSLGNVVNSSDYTNLF
jgi:hypothetical protein